VFHDARAGLLFAGDHVLPHITPSIGFEPLPADRPLADYLNSLAAVEALADAVLLPAHGPVAPSAHARAGELIEHHRKRLDAMLAVVAPGVSTAFEVAGQVGWTSREAALADLDVFNQMLAVNETIAHLDGAAIWAKREDCNSGLAFGGNKTRKLEYLVPDALAQGADTLVSIGGVQSNHTRQVAAVAARVGLKARLVQESWVEWPDPVYDRVGNIQLSRIMGADVRLDPSGFGIEF